MSLPITDSAWPINRNHTQADLDRLRAMSVADPYAPDVPFTCDTCSSRFNCDLVFDHYNTNGDCLADK